MWLVRDLVCVCGCEWGVRAVRDLLKVNRDQALQALRSSTTFGDRSLPKCVSGRSYSQGTAGSGEGSVCRAGVGILYRGISWVLETDYPLEQKLEMAGGVWEREEVGEGSICSELSAGSRHGHLTIDA